MFDLLVSINEINLLGLNSFQIHRRYFLVFVMLFLISFLIFQSYGYHINKRSIVFERNKAE